MIEGFEDITYKLTQEEQEKILPILLKGLLKKVGKEKAVTAKQIEAGLLKSNNIKVSGARVRKLVNFIRHNYLPALVASSKGYYITNDKQEVLRWVRSLEERETQIRAVRLNAEKFLTTWQQ